MYKTRCEYVWLKRGENASDGIDKGVTSRVANIKKRQSHTARARRSVLKINKILWNSFWDWILYLIRQKFQRLLYSCRSHLIWFFSSYRFPHYQLFVCIWAHKSGCVVWLFPCVCQRRKSVTVRAISQELRTDQLGIRRAARLDVKMAIFSRLQARPMSAMTGKQTTLLHQTMSIASWKLIFPQRKIVNISPAS